MFAHALRARSIVEGKAWWQVYYSCHVRSVSQLTHVATSRDREGSSLRRAATSAECSAKLLNQVVQR